MLGADVVAAGHAAAIALMVTGSLAALRWPRVLLIHLPMSLAILAVNLAGADCPLTTLELWLRSRAGGSEYSGGFLGHYVLAPLGLDVAATSVQVGIYAVAGLPNLLGLGLLTARALHRRADASASAESASSSAQA